MENRHTNTLTDSILHSRCTPFTAIISVNLHVVVQPPHSFAKAVRFDGERRVAAKAAGSTQSAGRSASVGMVA